MLHRLGPGLTYGQRGAAYTQRPDTYEKWREIAVESDRLRTDVEMDGSAWTGWLKKLFFDWDLRGRKKLGSSATDIVAFDRFFDSLDQLSRERGESELTVTEFASDVLDVLANVKTPIHAERGGVPVLLPNVVVGLAFQKIFFIGMAEGILLTA